MRHALMHTDPPQLLEPGRDFQVGEIVYSFAVLSRWSADELAAIGALPVAESELEVPAGSRVVGETIVNLDGVPTAQPLLEEIPFEEVRDGLLAAIRQKRWEVEAGGLDFNGVRIATDEKGQAKVAGCVQLFDKDPTLEIVDWEPQPNIWVTIDKATATALGVAVGRHVQACFTRCKDLCAAIQAAPDLAALLAIDINAGWPAAAA